MDYIRFSSAAADDRSKLPEEDRVSPTALQHATGVFTLPAGNVPETLLAADRNFFVPLIDLD